MKFRSAVAVLLIAVAVSACSSESKNERTAQRITEAVIANNLSSVKGDLAPGLAATITPVKLAEYSDELSQQGKLESVKETTPCTPGYHCFTVQFEKHAYLERMLIDEKGNVAQWNFKMASSGTTAQ